MDLGLLCCLSVCPVGDAWGLACELLRAYDIQRAHTHMSVTWRVCVANLTVNVNAAIPASSQNMRERVVRAHDRLAPPRPDAGDERQIRPSGPWDHPTTTMRIVVLLFLIVFFSGGLVLWPVLHRYGAFILYSPASKRLSLTAAEVDGILDEHQVLFLGGPHRGGTTILWQLLSAHASIGGFPEDSDSDFGEGAFLQSVLPTFGVGAARGQQRKTTTGLGRYAFDPASHMTEAHVTNSAEGTKQLVSEWGSYWNLSRPVLVEYVAKSRLELHDSCAQA